MAINVNASRSTINTQLLGKLSLNQPGGIKAKRGLSGTIGPKEAQQSRSKKLLSSLAIRENRTVKDLVGVGERGTVTGLDRSSRSVKGALKNVNRGVTAATEADSALADIEELLAKLKELAETSALSSTLPGERTELNQQFADLLDKLDKTSSDVKLGGVPLLDGTAGTPGFGGLDNLQVDVGTDAGSQYKLEFDTVTSESLDLDTQSLASEAEANTAVSAIDAAMITVKKARIGAQSDISKLSTTADRLTGRLDSLSTARSNLTDAQDASDSARALTQRDAATSLITQANVRPAVALRLLE